MSMTVTYIEELKAAVKLIRKECKKHTACSQCPLFFATCTFTVPSDWNSDNLECINLRGKDV